MFNELETLEQIAPGLKKVTGLKELANVEVDRAGNSITCAEKQQVEDLPQAAEGSVPRVPTFNFDKAFNK